MGKYNLTQMLDYAFISLILSHVRMFILTENQFSSCVLSQEEVDLQEYHVGEQGLVSLYNDLTFSGGDTTKQI